MKIIKRGKIPSNTKNSLAEIAEQYLKRITESGIAVVR